MFGSHGWLESFDFNTIEQIVRRILELVTGKDLTNHEPDATKQATHDRMENFHGHNQPTLHCRASFLEGPP